MPVRPVIPWPVGLPSLLAGLMVLAGCSDPGPSGLDGEWVVDPQATREKVQAGAAWAGLGAAQQEALLARVDAMADRMRVRFAGDRMETWVGGLKVVSRVTLTSRRGDRLRLRVIAGEEVDDLTVQRVGPDTLQFTGADEPAATAYVWRRAPPEPDGPDRAPPSKGPEP